jgi:PadR family transcriptional regulator, regulatory protein PadR
MHGGALQSALNSRLPSLKADSAAVYRSLKQMEKDGEVVSNWVTADSGPAIRVYRLTEAGWSKLDYWFRDVKERLENLNYFVSAYARLRGEPSIAARREP